MKLFNQFAIIRKLSPDRVLFTDAGRDYTAREVEDISGRVYAYLKAQNIGREDVVMIHMKRSAAIAFAFYGILKAGACAVIVDGDAEEKYYRYFREDCAPVLEINETLYRKILSEKHLSGFMQTEPHDAAFIIYTSGSTGMPKGCVHEYGDIDRYLTCLNAEEHIVEYVDERVAMVAEFYDIATITTLLNVIYLGSYIYVVPREVGRDPIRYAEVIRRNSLTTAILLQRLVDLDILETLPSLVNIYFGFEIVEKAYRPKLSIYNIYGMSESIFSLTYFLIDRSYDITPVGKPHALLETKLVDENLNEVRAGEIGRVAFPNPYFRGYLNKPEETERALRNGLFVSQDMGFINEDGNLVLVGRENDIIKTENGYIVPIFIQAEIRKLYPGEQILVKAYTVDGENRMVVFHLNSLSIDRQAVRESLAEKFPEYMLPTDYVGLDSFPLLHAGKIDGERLKAVISSRSDHFHQCPE